MNAGSGASGTGCHSARRRHGPISAARIATYLRARLPMLNLDNMVHNALGFTINNSVHHQQFSSPCTSRAPRAGAFDAHMPRASHALPPDCESPRATPHAPPSAPLIAHQLVHAACCTTSCEQHAREPPRGPGRRISKQDRVRSRSARAAIACARRQRRSHARQRQCEWLSVNGRWCVDRCLRRRPLPRRALIAPKRVGGGCMRVLFVHVVDPVWAVPASSPNQGAARGVGPRRRPRVAPTRPRAAEPRPSWQCGGGGGERGGERGRW